MRSYARARRLSWTNRTILFGCCLPLLNVERDKAAIDRLLHGPCIIYAHLPLPRTYQ